MRGMTWRRTGQSGFSGSIRLKKCGVTANASLWPDSMTPARSSRVSVILSSSWRRFVTRFLSCHFQSFQSSGATSGQYPGACETKSFPSPFSKAKVFIFVVAKKLRPLNIVSMQAPCRALRTSMNGWGGRFSGDLFLAQPSSPLPTRVNPVDA